MNNKTKLYLECTPDADRLLHAQVSGRQLAPPELQYNSRKIVPEPDRGSWDMRNTGFYRPGVIDSFAIACFCSQRSAGGPIEDPASLQVTDYDCPFHSTSTENL